MDLREKVKASQSSKCVESYAEWADSYDKDVETLPFNGPNIVATEMAALYPPETRSIEILDVCAGTGLVGEELWAVGFMTIDALDGSEAMLKKAEQKGVYRKLFCDRLGPNRLSIDDNRYDAMTGTGIFVPGHVKEDCLLELIRIVKPGGRLVFAMCETYLRDKIDFLNNLEPTMKRHEDNGLWRMIDRKIVPKYSEEATGIVFVFEVL